MGDINYFLSINHLPVSGLMVKIFPVQGLFRSLHDDKECLCRYSSMLIILQCDYPAILQRRSFLNSYNHPYRIMICMGKLQILALYINQLNIR